ncbi:unnamed protein product [Spodoptera littoralis]|uniref:Serpin domain-containing protein n=1 Tax=Spodoptera littoralis TaxID=7109 RepID=A0A9P0N843_SPOLI|nr:unnamed protein product [Spodoptera littoralis]CAH1643251.1 unnamed protein product [Spodoptera littoralis]
MRAHGRVPGARAHSVLLRSIYIYACISLTTASKYGVPIEIKLWDTGRTPLAHMVDVTNGFGLKVLAEHNFLNDNNIAFSPYGLMGIMVALYEGVDGESSYQIQRGMQLPWNRNIMRIGFRDIHRTLKTYFVPEEGFLAGLALNNENVTFNEPYRKILRFYGFDLENDQLPTLAPETNSTSSDTNSTTPNPAGSTDGTTTTEAMMTALPAREDASTASPNREETTTTLNPNAETISTIDIRGATSTAASPSSAPNAESTPMSTTVTTTKTETTTEIITEPTTQTMTTVQTETTTQGTSAADTEATTTIAPSTTTDMQTISMTSQVTDSLSTAMTNEPTTNNEVNTSSTAEGNAVSTTIDVTATTVPQTSTLDASTAQTSDDTTPSTADSSSTISTLSENTPIESFMTTNADTQPTEQMSTMTMDDMTTSLNSVTTSNETTLETLERKKKSIVDFIFTNPPYVEDYLYYRSYDIGSDVANPGFDDKMFLANGLRSVQVTYMRYDTVLEHAYLPHLEASALRLPLDSDRYYLLVVLPSRGGAPELGRLLSRMARESDLSDIYSVLRPRRVKGIVPSFTVKGHVTLTTDLQKLGIRDVFEPRQRDFTLMTKQAGVYVRSIEQAVSVAIRKYRPDDQKKNRYVSTRDPVIFSATYPFLYFVMDANIHVALMAGKMVDPLNSRIL